MYDPFRVEAKDWSFSINIGILRIQACTKRSIEIEKIPKRLHVCGRYSRCDTTPSGSLANYQLRATNI